MSGVRGRKLGTRNSGVGCRIEGDIVRRFGRILGNILAAVSLLLAIGVAGMWVRSYCKKETWCRWRYSKAIDETKLFRAVSERGRMEVTFLQTQYSPGVMIVEEGTRETKLTIPGFRLSYPHGWWKFEGGVSPPAPQYSWEHLGVFLRLQRGVRWPPSPGVGSHIYLGAPYWLLFVLTICTPALCGMRWWKRRRRIREGRCLKCGYDLRESPGRCPECGAVAEVAA